MKSLGIRVYGRVQGVFFRASTKEIADQLGLNGFVMNMPDGTVFIEVRGDEKALLKFQEWCRTGPPSARVDKLDIQPVDLLTSNPGFEVRR